MTSLKFFFRALFFTVALNQVLFAGEIDCTKVREVNFFDICRYGASYIPTAEEAICAIRKPNFDPNNYINSDLNDNLVHRDQLSTFFCANYIQDPQVVNELLFHPALDIVRTRNFMIEAFLIALKSRMTEFVLTYLKRADFDLRYIIERNDSYDLKYLLRYPIKTRDLKSFEAILNHPTSEILDFGGDRGVMEALLGEIDDPIIFQMFALLVRSPRLDPNYPNHRPLELAIYSKNNRALQLLLSNPKLDLNFERQNFSHTPLSLSIKLENVDAFDELLKRPQINVNPNSDDGQCTLTMSPLILAIESKNNYFLSKLLERQDLDINSTGYGYNDWSNFYTTPVGAALVHNLPLAKELLKRKDLEINHKTCGDKTPIYELYFSSPGLRVKPESFELLINRADTDVNIETRNGSVLKEALNSADNDYLEPLKTLLKRRDLNVNQSTTDYDTPLHSFLYGSQYRPRVKVLTEFLKRSDVNCNIHVPNWKLSEEYKDVLYQHNCHVVYDQF